MKQKKYDFEEVLDEDDLSIYSRQVREEWLEDDELSPAEEAFMTGYDNAI